MDKDTRNAIERATQHARKLLEEDFAGQLEGDFDVHRRGVVAAKASAHLSARQAFQRDSVVASIEHKRAVGMGAPEAVADYLRDAAFTTLNRFIALKMLEARELVQESITKGEQSAGYREFCGMAPGLPLLPNSAGYRLYIESLFDELSTEVKVLFDRRDPSSVLWPRRATFEQLLEILNASELGGVWGEDETIGWVYQYFNGADERRKMRDESQAPRNSRELAVRNQFFTPRYVVQFLTDNTLGRIWYEMRGTKTVLAERCQYMVRRPGEQFTPRVKKDPRDLRVLDPACGSGHFLLYAFDLFFTLYEEAYVDLASPKSEATGRTLADDYPSVDALRRAVPGLILEYNLHGVDIDPRCAQIAQLALWMRAQRAYRDVGITRAERPPNRRSNIVVAEPLVADEQLVKEFVARLGDAELGRVFTALVDALKLAGDLGLLLRIETLVARPSGRGQAGDLFAPAEERIRAALARFVAQDGGRPSTRKRLFADDAAQAVGLVGIATKAFDVVLMNPPFGVATPASARELERCFPAAYTELYACFVDRALQLAPTGLVGVISSRGFLSMMRLTEWRRASLVPRLRILIDLGVGVMDSAFVRACAYIIGGHTEADLVAIDLQSEPDIASALLKLCQLDSPREMFVRPREFFDRLPESRLIYRADEAVAQLFDSRIHAGDVAIDVRAGLQTFDNERFVRLAWEVEPTSVGRNKGWEWFAKGGEFAKYHSDLHLVINRDAEGAELAAFNEIQNGQTAQVRRSSDFYYRQGAFFTSRSGRGLSVRRMPRDCVFAHNAPAVFAKNAVSDLYLLGWLNSRLVRALTEMQASADYYTAGSVKLLPWAVPSEQSVRMVEASVRQLLLVYEQPSGWDETSVLFRGIPVAQSLEALHQSVMKRCEVLRREASSLQWSVSGEIDKIYAIDSRGIARDLLDSDPDDDIPIEAPDLRTLAQSVLSFLVGVAFGRWSRAEPEGRKVSIENDPYVPLPAQSPRHAKKSGPEYLVEDAGHARDLVAAVERAADELGIVGGSVGLTAVLDAVESPDVRHWLRRECLAQHVGRYSASRRTAPVYWQLSVSSGQYAVWLHIDSIRTDTLHVACSEAVAPKLAHEERRLDSMRREPSGKPTAAERKAIAAQEAFVDELRAFFDELQRIAPLWKPNRDDGVIINFAPFWRLVPQHRPWQKKLKATWDGLGEGKYDWAHLAMHLWPERVVPKCATDRSLAVAHGLEDAFWVEGSDGKWTARRSPTRSVEELVRDRTSPAVKAALKSLLEAPLAGSRASGGRGRVGRGEALGSR